jgi:hypothetical protein
MVVVVVVVVVDTGASGSQLTIDDRVGAATAQELKIPAATTTVIPRRTNVPLTETT